MTLKQVHDELVEKINRHRDALEEYVDDYVSEIDTEDGAVTGDAALLTKLRVKMDEFFNDKTIPFLTFLALAIRRVLKISQKNFGGDFKDIKHLEHALGIKDGKIRKAMEGKTTVLYAIGAMKVLENDMVLMVNNSLNGEVARKDLKKSLHRIVSRKYYDFFETYAIGALMQTYNAAQYTYAKKFGYKRFLYVGGLIDESRDFCVERDGHEFTYDQGKEWDDLWWKGKIEGVPFFIQCGGYNCRHHIEWVEE